MREKVRNVILIPFIETMTMKPKSIKIKEIEEKKMLSEAEQTAKISLIAREKGSECRTEEKRNFLIYSAKFGELFEILNWWVPM